MPFVSITRLRIRSLWFMPGFMLHATRSLGQTRGAAGFLSGSLLADRDRAFWTMTLWDSAESMRAYMTSGSHRRAMPKLMRWCDEASVVHWTQADAAAPAWADADRRMRAEGRASKLRHPAPGHAALHYRAPRLSGAMPIRRR